MHVKVGEAAADAVGFTVECNIFALGGGDNTVPTVMAADGKTVVLQLWEGEEICNSVPDEPSVEEVLEPSFIGGEISTRVTVGTNGDARRF